MRILPLLIVLAASLVGPVSVEAAPVSGQDEQDPRQPQDDPERNVPMRPELDGFLSVFDSEGLPMLHVSAPTYLYLGERRKLRHQDLGNNDGNNNGGNEGESGDGETPPAPIIPNPRAVPEPAAMLMLVPAAILAIRKSRRGKNPRS